MKAQVDVFLLMAYFLGAAIGIGAALYITGDLFGNVQANPQFASCSNCINALNKGIQAQNNVANSLVLVFLLSCFATIILSAFLDSSPVFLLFVIISLPIELLVSFVFHDVWFAIASQSFIGSALTGVPSIALAFQWLPVIVLVMSIIIAVVTFTR